MCSLSAAIRVCVPAMCLFLAMFTAANGHRVEDIRFATNVVPNTIADRPVQLSPYGGHRLVGVSAFTESGLHLDRDRRGSAHDVESGHKRCRAAPEQALA